MLRFPRWRAANNDTVTQRAGAGLRCLFMKTPSTLECTECLTHTIRQLDSHITPDVRGFSKGSPKHAIRGRLSKRVIGPHKRHVLEAVNGIFQQPNIRLKIRNYFKTPTYHVHSVCNRFLVRVWVCSGESSTLW